MVGSTYVQSRYALLSVGRAGSSIERRRVGLTSFDWQERTIPADGDSYRDILADGAVRRGRPSGEAWRYQADLQPRGLLLGHFARAWNGTPGTLFSGHIATHPV